MKKTPRFSVLMNVLSPNGNQWARSCAEEVKVAQIILIMILFRIHVHSHSLLQFLHSRINSIPITYKLTVKKRSQTYRYTAQKLNDYEKALFTCI